ncbi:MAG: ABC transporter permease subunit [Acidimicrobiales bacterium]
MPYHLHRDRRASTIVGGAKRGTGEFLAHSPAHEREIYLGKLIASLLPGYATTLLGFGVYSLVVNLFVGPEVGGWFFPTQQWWVLMLWVVPPFLALTLSIVLRLSARVKSTAAAQQAAGLVTLPMIGIAYSQSTGALGADAGLILGAARLGGGRRGPGPGHAGGQSLAPARRERRRLTLSRSRTPRARSTGTSPRYRTFGRSGVR